MVYRKSVKEDLKGILFKIFAFFVGLLHTLVLLILIFAFIFACGVAIHLLVDKETWEPKTCEPPNCQERVFYPDSVY